MHRAERVFVAASLGTHVDNLTELFKTVRSGSEVHTPTRLEDEKPIRDLVTRHGWPDPSPKGFRARASALTRKEQGAIVNAMGDRWNRHISAVGFAAIRRECIPFFWGLVKGVGSQRLQACHVLGEGPWDRIIFVVGSSDPVDRQSGLVPLMRIAEGLALPYELHTTAVAEVTRTYRREKRFVYERVEHWTPEELDLRPKAAV